MSVLHLVNIIPSVSTGQCVVPEALCVGIVELGTLASAAVFYFTDFD